MPVVNQLRQPNLPSGFFCCIFALLHSFDSSILEVLDTRCMVMFLNVMQYEATKLNAVHYT